jgi:uncharacterized RDD family membrane protein YckC
MFSILGADGKEYGPVSAPRIQEWIAGGRANLQTKARRAGETEWRTLGDYPEFGAAPVPAVPGVPPAVATSNPAPVAVAAAVPDQPLAGLGRRFLAAFIDGLLKSLCMVPLCLAIMGIVGLAMANPSEPPDPEKVSPLIVAGWIQSLPLLLLLAVVQITLLCLRSQTIGKLLLGIQIVNVSDGQRAGPLNAFVLRSLVPLMIGFVPFIGFFFWIVDICFIFRSDQRCIHDLIASTKVVKR